MSSVRAAVPLSTERKREDCQDDQLLGAAAKQQEWALLELYGRYWGCARQLAVR
ncbi:hypothetical protein [Deinococcus irradiatisoli]|uniref:hypothetical protein n=1 Tax=Deinococcus irradiatisoli TaxID=2202254 RepID=UPI0015E846D6|nr:hypothetical protein [Deinococcus irradiatisoli]